MLLRIVTPSARLLGADHQVLEDRTNIFEDHPNRPAARSVNFLEISRGMPSSSLMASGGLANWGSLTVTDDGRGIVWRETHTGTK